MDVLNGVLFVSLGFVALSAAKRLVIVCCDLWCNPDWRSHQPAAFVFAHRREITLAMLVGLLLTYLALILPR